MAKIKTSALVADIKGTVGGNVFAANKGGNYVRRYKKPTNANTEKQQNVRSSFGYMAGQWRQLTDIERNSWNEGAVQFPYMDKLGEMRVYSGQQLFNKLNNNLVQLGYPIIETCPTPQSFPEVVISTIVNTVTDNILGITIAYDGAITSPPNFVTIVHATAPMSKGVSAPQKGLFKKIQTIGPEEDVDVYYLNPNYTNNFGELILEDFIYLGVTIVNLRSGEASTMITKSSTRLA